MKTLSMKQRRLLGVLTPGLFAIAALGAVASFASPAHADIVARARIGGADVRVRLQTPDRVVVHAPAPRIVVRHPAPVHTYSSIRWSALSRDDHRIAARLSLLTGVAERRLLAQRSHGWSWKRIGRYHGVHQHVIAQARSHRPLHTAVHMCNGCCDDRDRRGKGGRGARR